MTREDVGWGLGVALAVLLLFAALPLVPVAWLVGRIDS